MNEATTPTIDIASLKQAAVNTIIEGLNGVIIGVDDDIRVFANAIVVDTTEAAAAGRLDLLPVLADQTKVLLEGNRLRIVQGAEATFFKVLQIALGILAKVVIPTVPTIPLV